MPLEPREVGLGDGQVQVRLMPRPEGRRERAGRDPPLGFRQHAGGKRAGGGHGRVVAPQSRLLRGCRGGLHAGRCADRDLRRVVRLEHPLPLAVRHGQGLGLVAAPQRQAHRGALHQRRPLADRHGFQLQQRLADDPGRLFVAVRFDQHQAQVQRGAEPGHAGRRPLHGGARLGLGLVPAAQLEQDVGRVPAQERAVGGGEARRRVRRAAPP